MLKNQVAADAVSVASFCHVTGLFSSPFLFILGAQYLNTKQCFDVELDQHLRLANLRCWVSTKVH